MQALLSLGRLQADQSLGGRMEDDEMVILQQIRGASSPPYRFQHEYILGISKNQRSTLFLTFNF